MKCQCPDIDLFPHQTLQGCVDHIASLHDRGLLTLQERDARWHRLWQAHRVSPWVRRNLEGRGIAKALSI